MRRWKNEDLEYLRENWGKYGEEKIARDLNKSREAVRRMRNILGFDSAINYTEYFKMVDIQRLLGFKSITPIKNFRKLHGLPLKKRPRISKKYSLITIEELTNWLKDHQDLWDSKNLELYGLGIEYDWLKEKRKLDRTKEYKRFKMWSEQEISLAQIMFSNGKSLEEISEKINRNPDSIRKKLADIYNKQRGNNYVRKNVSCM